MKSLCLGLFLVVAASGAANAKDCDRACLAGLVTTYVDALVAHKPDALPLAANVRFTEDMKELKLGEGLWRDITRAGTFRQDYLDIRKQIAAAHVELYAGDRQVLYSVVLHPGWQDHRHRDPGRQPSAQQPAQVRLALAGPCPS